jgi:hypothetical protein
MRYARNALILVSLLLALSLLACSVLSPRPDVTYSGSSKYKPQPSTSTADVELVYIGQSNAELPRGVSLNPEATYTDGKVLLESDYPTAEQPHVMVGEYTVRNAESVGKEAIEQAIRERAAKDGADIVFMDAGSGSVTGLAVYLSDAEPAAVERKPAEELLAEEASMPEQKGYTKVMKTAKRTLDAFEPVRFQAERGTCYWLTFALAEDAAFSSHARKSLGFNFDSVDYDIAHSAGMPTIEEKTSTGQLSRAARSGTKGIGCPQKTGELAVDLQAKFGSAQSKDRVHELGEGEVVFRIYTKSVTEKELAKQKKESEERWDAAEKSRIERNRRICRACARELVKCGDKDPRFCAPYTNCIARKSGRLNFCLEGR